MAAFRRLFRRRLHPWKVVTMALIFVTFLFLIQREIVIQTPEEGPFVGKRDTVLDMMMGAVHNFRGAVPKMQIKAPVRQSEGAGGDPCLPGRYTAAELRPALERPAQDPGSPGASGKPFQTDDLTPAEQKEKERGETKHCFNLFASDRISLSRDLGPDTRPPEYVFVNALARHTPFIVNYNESLVEEQLMAKLQHDHRSQYRIQSCFVPRF